MSPLPVYIALITLIVSLFVSGTESYAQETPSSTATSSVETSTGSTTTTNTVTPRVTAPGNSRPPTALSAQTQTRIQNLAFNIANRLDATHSRLTQIADRLQRRIDKIAATGITTTNAQAEVTAAYALLETIRTDLDTFDERIFTTTTSENPREDWRTTRSAIAANKADLERVRSLLIASVLLLQTATPEAAPEDVVSTTSTQ